MKWSDYGWKPLACGCDMEPGVHDEAMGRKNVLLLHPVSQTQPAAIELRKELPARARELLLDIFADRRGDFVLKIFLNDTLILDRVIDTKGRWTTVNADLRRERGNRPGSASRTLPMGGTGKVPTSARSTSNS